MPGTVPSAGDPTLQDTWKALSGKLIDYVVSTNQLTDVAGQCSNRRSGGPGSVAVERTSVGLVKASSLKKEGALEGK